MAGEFSNAGADIALNKVFRDAGVTLYMGLATVPVTDGMDLSQITEVSSAGYARKQVVFTAPAGDPRQVENNAQIEFGPFTADPPAVAYAFCTDVAAGAVGAIRSHWAGNVVDAALNESIRIAAGALKIGVD